MIWLALLLSGCDTDDTAACGTKQLPVAAVTNVPLSGHEVAADLVLQGTVTSPAFAVLRVSVMGVPATSSAGDFDTWTATVPISVLRSFGVGEVPVDVLVSSTCTAAPMVAGTITVDVAPAMVPGTGLSLEVVPPHDCHLPSDGSASAEISLCADAVADEAEVTVTASSGSVSGLTEGRATLRAGGNDACAEGEVGAVAFLTAATPGTIAVTAIAPEVNLLRDEVVVAGAPAAAPASSVTVPAGGTRTVLVRTDGILEACTVTRDVPGDFGVSVDGVAAGDVILFPLEEPTEPPDPCDLIDAGEEVHAFAFVAAVAPVGGSVTVVCADVFGQELVVTASTEPPPPP